jgi:3alpha(or 20beta)-hydroxysteroid dehydrogenase
MAEFSGKVAVVTGATGGIGSDIAIRLAAEGCFVVATDMAGSDSAPLLQKLGPKSAFKTLDVTSEENWRTVMDEVSKEHGGLDILVNCAGYFKPHVPFEELTIALWRQHFAINSDSAFMGAQAAVAPMKKRGGGSVVNISTALVNKMLAGAAAYIASKAALIAVTKLSALALAKHNIRVNAILPGAVETDMLYRNLRPGETREWIVDFYTKQHPLGRIAQPKDISDIILFLASERATFITGGEFSVDGGQGL